MPPTGNPIVWGPALDDATGVRGASSSMADEATAPAVNEMLNVPERHDRALVCAVIPAGRDREAVRRCIGGLEGQEGLPAGAMEVIVVADGFPREVRDGVAAAHPALDVRVVEHVHAGPAAARNAGWTAASADLVLFLDDSLVATPGLVAEHLRRHRMSPDGVVVGPVLGPKGGGPAWSDYEAWSRQRQYRALEQAGRLRGLPAGGNFSIPRSVLVQVGGFDGRRLRGEHVHLGLTLRDAGVPLLYEPAAVVRDESIPVYQAWRDGYRLQGRMDVATYRDRRYGGVAVLVAAFHDRHPLNRASVRLALRWPGLAPVLESAYRTVGAAAHRMGLAAVSRRAFGGIANLAYWKGVAEGLRGASALRQLLRETRHLADRPYRLAGYG